jgi:poly(3-hydroxybutyrate) depolymerase
MSLAFSLVRQKSICVKNSILLCFLCLLVLCPCLYANSVILDNSGDFVFDYNNSGNTGKIKVYYYAPKNLPANSQIVFVLHGDSRNAAVYRNEWKTHAENYHFLVICPEFTESEFPYLKYNCANIYNDEKKNYNPKEKWTFNIIEKLFDFVKNDRQMKTETYCIFGHSAGGQVVQRMVLFMPEARFSLAIANGCGAFTMPNFEQYFPEGIKSLPLTQESVKKSFEKNMVILMGEKDFVSKTSPGSYAKATHKWDRLWRARFFYNDAKAEAGRLGAQFNWSFRIVPDADHNNPKHALFASGIIAASRRNSPENKAQPSPK